MIRLYVNVDHVATLREARKTYEPDPLEVAILAEKAGAYGITIHLREDRRHIQDFDVKRLKETVNVPLNLEMAAVDEMVEIALNIKPAQVSIVPEKRQELTTEGGLDIISQEGDLINIGNQLKSKKILLNLFVDPVSSQIKAAKRIGADSIELNTGPYSQSNNLKDIQHHLKKLSDAAKQSRVIGLGVFAGHGLTNKNIQKIVAIPEIEELNIGHHIISRSIYVGIEQSVKEILTSIKSGLKLRP